MNKIFKTVIMVYRYELMVWSKPRDIYKEKKNDTANDISLVAFF